MTLTGLFLQGGVGDTPFPPNPWNVAADAGLSQALSHIWRPIADLAPRFLATLHARTLGLALLTDDDGTLSLGYITWGRDEDRDPPRGQALRQATSGQVTLDQVGAHDVDAYLRVVVGTAPKLVDPTAVMPLLAGPVPTPVRDLWSVRHRLGPSSGGGIGGDLSSNMLSFSNGADENELVERAGGHPPDRFILSVGSNASDEDFVLDLDLLDSAGNPTVARWAFKESELGNHKPFWDWLDSDGILLTLL